MDTNSQSMPSDHEYRKGKIIQQIDTAQNAGQLVEDTLIADPVMGVIHYDTRHQIPRDPILDDAVDTVLLDKGVSERAAEYDSPGDPAVEVFPNPGAGQFTVKYELRQPSVVRIELFDLSGRHLRSLVRIDGQHAGQYYIPFEVERSPGLYVLNCVINGVRKSVKVIVE